MNKNIYYFLLIFFIFGCGVFKNAPTQEEQYEKILICQGSQDELYEKANEWLVHTIKTATSIESRIDVQDKEKGKLSALYISGLTAHPTNTETPIRIHIDVKDNTARILCEFEEQPSVKSMSSAETFYWNEIDRSELADNSGGNAEIMIKTLLNDFASYMVKE